MLQALKARASVRALQWLGRDRVDYLASNTMMVLNRAVNDFLWTYDLKAVVTAVRDEAPGVKSFTLMPNQHWQGMQAGQYVEVTVDADGRTLTRCYSPTVLPDGGIRITVKRAGLGEVSGWMHDWLKPGGVLGLSQAQGCFRYRGQDKLLFLCAGSGITPCHAMIAERLASGDAVDMQLHARFATAADVIFAETLRDWKSRLPVDIALSREVADGYSALLTPDNFEARYPDFRDRDIYLCGPAGFMESLVLMLTNLGYNLGRLHTERFTQNGGESLGSLDFQSAPPEIRFNHLNATVQLTAEDAGLTLLEAARRHGVPVESGCCKGMCGSCKLTLKEGKVSGNALGQAVYLCTSYPDSAKVVLDA